MKKVFLILLFFCIGFNFYGDTLMVTLYPYSNERAFVSPPGIEINSTTSFDYAAGTPVELRADSFYDTPDENGCGVDVIFDHWEGDLIGNDNPATVTVSGAMNVIAVFNSYPYPCESPTPSPSPTPQPTYWPPTNCFSCKMNITGNVTDSLDNPVSGVIVSLLSTPYALTDSQGNYSFSAPGILDSPDCPPGDTLIFFDAIGYKRAERFIPVTCRYFPYTYYVSLVRAPVQSGIVFFDPVEKNVNVNESFTWEIHVDSGSQKIASYDITVSWAMPDLLPGLSVDTSIGNIGVDPGTDGFDLYVHADTRFIRIRGFDPGGEGPGNDLHLCTIHFIAGHVAMDAFPVFLTIDSLLDETDTNVGNHKSNSGTVTITNNYTLGDVNDDGYIDIIDALFAAQYYVDIPVQQFNITAADVDCNQMIDIIDALLIAQYYVGIRFQFPCNENNKSPAK